MIAGAGVEIFGREWGFHTLIGGTLLMVVGTQVLGLGLCAHAYGTYFMGEKDPWFDRMRARFRLEHGLMLGGAVHAHRVRDGRGDRRDLDRPRVRLALQGATRGGGRALLIVGIQIFFSSFLLSILGLRRR